MENTFMRDLGESAKAIRQAKGMSQQEVANVIGVDVRTINRFENGHNFSHKVAEWYGFYKKEG